MAQIVSFVRETLILYDAYPAEIQVPHAMMAAFSFRSSYSAEDWYALPIWHKVIGGFFCHGYGGTTCRDLVFTTPPSIASHINVPKFWIIGMVLTYYSPSDIIYRHISEPKSLGGALVRFVESCDVSTTICGAFEKGARLQRDSPTAPYVAAMAAALGGGIFRWFERKGRNVPVTTEWCKPTGSIQKATVYIAAYAFFRGKIGVRRARLYICTFRLIVDMIGLFRGEDSDPAVHLTEALLQLFDRLKIVLSLGPPPPKKLTEGSN